MKATAMKTRRMTMRIYDMTMRMAARCVAAALATLMLTACSWWGDDEDAHNGEGGVSFALTWQDADDGGTAINGVRLWIYKKGGGLVGEYRYGSAAELANVRINLTKGDYVAVVATNLDSPFSAEDTGGYESLLLALGEASSSPSHAHYATAEFTYSGSGSQTVKEELARVMSELTVVIEGAPDGATLTTTVTNASTGVLPAVKDGDGRYGTAAGGQTTDTMPEATAQGGVITTETVRLMPTADGDSSSMLHFTLALANGTVQEFDAEAPQMKPSGKYVITLKYAEMKAWMRIATVTINDWTEGWAISGEITDPDESF